MNWKPKTRPAPNRSPPQLRAGNPPGSVRLPIGGILEVERLHARVVDPPLVHGLLVPVSRKRPKRPERHQAEGKQGNGPQPPPRRHPGHYHGDPRRRTRPQGRASDSLSGPTRHSPREWDNNISDPDRHRDATRGTHDHHSTCRVSTQEVTRGLLSEDLDRSFRLTRPAAAWRRPIGADRDRLHRPGRPSAEQYRGRPFGRSLHDTA